MHVSFFFFFNDTATTEIYTLSLHDALPICSEMASETGVADDELLMAIPSRVPPRVIEGPGLAVSDADNEKRSEEHTSELQSPCNLVCRLLLEKKKNHAPMHLAGRLVTSDRY